MTLTVAAGSADGETARLMSTIAMRLASTNAPVRLQVVDEGNALDAAKAFSGGQVTWPCFAPMSAIYPLPRPWLLSRGR